MKITIKNSWDSLSWKEYEQLEQILNTDIPSDYKTVHVIALLSGLTVEEIERIPVNQFNKILPALEFLQTEPETHYHQFEYTINGREYDFKGKLQEITTAQYIDYRAYISEDQKDIVKLMSVFLIPKGHEYNDGYDMEQVINDINDMCWLDLRAAAFFFQDSVSSVHTHFEVIFGKDPESNEEEQDTAGEEANTERHNQSGGAFEQYGLLPLVLRVCEYSNDGFDTVMSWSVCQTFYIASYIITKNKYDEQQIKQMQLKNKQR